MFEEPEVPHVSVDDVQKAMSSNDVCIIVDVRTHGEYARAHIAGSIHLPLDTIHQDVRRLIPDTSTRVYVYCLSGSRSAYAVDMLMHLGYTNVYDVRHGLLGWRAKYFPLVS